MPLWFTLLLTCKVCLTFAKAGHLHFKIGLFNYLSGYGADPHCKVPG